MATPLSRPLRCSFAWALPYVGISGLNTTEFLVTGSGGQGNDSPGTDSYPRTCSPGEGRTHTCILSYGSTKIHFYSAIVRNFLTNNSISVRRWLIIMIMDLFSGRPFRSHGSISDPLTLYDFPACFVPLPGSPHLVLAPPALPLCIHPCMFFPPICHGVFYCFFCIFTHITSPFKSVLIPFARPVMASTITLIVSNRTPLR